MFPQAVLGISTCNRLTGLTFLYAVLRYYIVIHGTNRDYSSSNVENSFRLQNV